MTDTKYPLINGTAPSWSSIRFSIDSHGRAIGISKISYKDTFAREKVRGEGAVALEMTAGEHDCEASMTMTWREHRRLMSTLAAKATASGVGIGEVPFTLTVLYRIDGSQLIEDTLEGCRLKEIGQDHESGPKGLMAEVPLDIMRIKWGGVYAAQSSQEQGGS